MLQAPISKSEEDKIFMQRCLQLAYHAVDTAAPNPMVGAVVVHQGKIIGEGWHRKAGQPHAEPNAIRSVKNQSLLKESTLYVSLEPCSHYGKTPPCADLIIEKGIPRVVIGCEDPFPEVSGRGIRKLQEAGIEVVVGVEREACLQLNRAFITYHLQHRPYITLKWAQTADGKIDRIREPQESALQISDHYTAMMVHKLRHESDAILVGRNTVYMDNPSLSIRHWPSENKPLRILFDRNNQLSAHAKIFDGSQASLIFTEQASKQEVNNEWIQAYTWPEIMEILYRKGIQRLLVEGGRKIHQSLIDNNLWDEIQIETAPFEIGSGIDAPQLHLAEKKDDFIIVQKQAGSSDRQICHIVRKIYK